MPETYLDSSVLDFNHQDALDARIDSYGRMSSILNRENNPAINQEFAYNLSTIQDGISQKLEIPSVDIHKALISKDPEIRKNAQLAFDQKLKSDPVIKYNIGNPTEYPYTDEVKKFETKKFGYSNFRDNEDFYYNNSYMKNGFITRNFVINPMRFLGRAVGGGVLKLFEGLGYVGSMITSIGNENYWADVADNGFSRWFEQKEQSFKDQIIPVYKQAGFDEKGFFTKLTDWSFWNDSVADATAFMLSAAIPGTAISKIGTVGKFGQAFSIGSKIGNIASKIGMGSPAELTTWAFNTASEAAFEASSVYKDASSKMKELRKSGNVDYINLTDEDIKERAGKLAANTILGNVLVLSLSNAWENKLFFGKSNKPKISISDTFELEDLKPISRAKFYGEKAIEGIIAEGLWEENAQLAIQRLNTIDEKGGTPEFTGSNFAKLYFSQIINAINGKDKEAAESIGLGGLIGIGAGIGLSKLSGERKRENENIKNIINEVRSAKENLLSITDIYERDKDGKIVYEDNSPKVNEIKLKQKAEKLSEISTKIEIATKKDFYNSPIVDFQVKNAIATYIRALDNIGVNNIINRFDSVNTDTASIFGIDPTNINEKFPEYQGLISSFLNASKKTNNINFKGNPFTISATRSTIYGNLSQNIIISDISKKLDSQNLEILSQTKNLSNTSLSESLVDKINNLNYQKYYINLFKNSNEFDKVSELEKEFYDNKSIEIDKEISKFKNENSLLINESKEDKNGFYIALDSDKNEIKIDPIILKNNKLISQYKIIIDKNNFIVNKLSDVDNFEQNLKKTISDNPDIFTSFLDEIEYNIFKKYNEKNEGDFSKIVTLTSKLIENKELDNEELLLRDNYKDLVNELFYNYKNALIESGETKRTVEDIEAEYLKLTGTPIDKVSDSLSINESLSSEFTNDLITDNQTSDNYDGADFLRPLSTKFYTSTFIDARDEMDNYDLTRFNKSQIDHFEFLQFLSDDTIEKNFKGKLKILSLTSDNLEKYKLKDYLYTNNQKKYWDDTNISTKRIELIHVIEQNNKLFYIDKNLNLLEEVGNPISDPSKLVRTILRSSEYKSSENYSKYSTEQINSAKQHGLDLRKKIIESSVPLIFDFSITKGVANKIKDQSGSYRKNPIINHLISEIGPDSIIIATENPYILDGNTIELPLGRAFLKAKNGTLHNIDNNIISDNIVDNLLNIFSNLSKEYTQTIETIMAKKLNGKKLSDLSPKQKNNILLESSKIKGKKFNTTYLNYIRSVVNFDIAKRFEKDGQYFLEKFDDNKIYIFGSEIHFNGKKIDITNSDEFLKSKDFKDFLKSQHHNILYKSNIKDRSAKYIELYTLNNKIEKRVWSSYNDYLLSDKYPDGKKREYIPITTSIKTKEQHSLENTDTPYFSYFSRAIILAQPLVTNMKKQKSSNIEIGEELNEDDEFEFEDIKIPDTIQEEPTKKEEKKEVFEGSLIQQFNEIMANRSGKSFRISSSGPFKKESDLDNTIKYVKSILPQFPIERLKNVIKTLDNREAFGEFTGDAIRIWEDAEEGTLYHEVFEAVANRILSDYEWKSLEKEFKSRKGFFLDRESQKYLTYSSASSQQIKEQLAEEFREYKLTGKLPTTKNTKTFFQVILDFIKSLFNNLTTIKSIFENIDKGKFKDSNILSQNRFASNYSIINYPIPVKEYSDFLNGFTIYMFKEIFESEESLSYIDEIGEIDSKIYEKVKKNVSDHFFDTLNEVKNEEERIKVLKAIDNWKKILENWGDFVKHHKLTLRPYQIKFDDEYILSDEENDNKNRNDYTESAFKINVKNSASPSVKFLIGTILKCKVDRNHIDQLNGEYFPTLDYETNSSFLPKLENYDKLMLRVVNTFSDLNSLSKIESKLREVSKIEKLQENQQDTINSMNEDDISMALLYSRLFGKRAKISEEAYINLRIRFLNYVSKQKPQPYIGIITENGFDVIKSNERPTIEFYINKIQSSMYQNSNKFFNISYKNDKKVFKPKDIDYINLSDYFIDNSKGQKDFNEFIKFIGINDIITPLSLSILNDNDRIKLGSLLLKIRDIISKKEISGKLTLRNLDIFGYVVNDLIPLLQKNYPLSEESMQYSNGDNEQQSMFVLPSFISKITADYNNSTYKEIVSNFPFLLQDFSKDSIILDRIKKGEKIKLSYFEGYKDREGKFRKMAKLELHERLGINFILSLQGMYTSLPADSETEWLFNFGEFVEYNDDLINLSKDDILKLFILKLTSEINQAKNFLKFENLKQLNQKHNDINREIGKSLRFFKDILDEKTVVKIHEGIDSNLLTEDIITRYSDDISKSILNYLQKVSDETKDNLIKNRVISTIGSQYIINNLPINVENKFGGNIFTEDQLNNIILYSTLNSTIAYIEQFKVYFGDPAQYKDWEKRAKSMFSPTEQTFFDERGNINDWFNSNKNKVGRLDLSDNDLFRHNFSNSLRFITINDINTVNADTVNSLIEIGSKLAMDYESSNEADGQSIISLSAMREFLIKSGWRWTKENEEYYQYDNALARKELSKRGIYQYNDSRLELADNNIINSGKKGKEPNPIKPLGTGVSTNGNHILLKDSMYSLSFQNSVKYNGFDLYLNMLKNKIDILNFESAQKVGIQLNTPDYYINPFETINLETIPTTDISFKTLGIQVETQGSKKGQTIGSQLTKDIYLNLFESGIPSDWNNDLSLEERINKWLDSTQEEKEKSNYYKLAKNVIITLNNLKQKSVVDTLDRIGIDYDYDQNNNIIYKESNLKKLQDFIFDELSRLEIDINSIESIELKENFLEFKNPAETLPSYDTVANVLWALADKSINSIKLNGKPYIQVASSFFNEKRKGSYKEDGIWKTIDNINDYTKVVNEGKNVILTSSDLQFYSLKDGKIQEMEVLLPNKFIKKVNTKREKLGLPSIKEDELLNYLQDNPKLLQGIGFRIPTQALSSIEFFKIKGFLPENSGDYIVVPSGITTKAGSDFDIDKLNTYLSNFILDSKGLPIYEDYTDNENILRNNYESKFLPKTKLLNYIKREAARAGYFDNNDVYSKIFRDVISGDTDYLDFLVQEEVNIKNYTYQDLVKDAENEKPKISYQEFLALPDHLKNSFGAVQNKYFESIRDILSLPERFEQLLSINNMDNIKSMKKLVFDAKGIKNTDKKINYSNFANMSYIVQKRQAFAKGKYDIGIFAVAMTNFANSQITGLGIGETNVSKSDSYIMKINNWDISLPFEEVKVLNIKGSKFIPISLIKNNDEKYIMDIISGYINGAVDVAKEPDIVDMGMHTELAGIYMILERMGVSSDKIALFMQQPSVREWLKETIFLKNKSFGFSIADNHRDLLNKLFNKYELTYEKINISLDDLKRSINKSYDEMSGSEKKLQALILANFLKLKVYATHLFQSVQGSNHDTSKIRSPYSLFRKDLIFEKSKEGNVIVSIDYTNGIEKLRKDTSIEKSINLFNLFQSVFEKTNIFLLQKENPKSTVRKFLENIYDTNPYLSADNFDKIAKEAETSIIDLLINNKVLIEDNQLISYTRQFFKPEYELDGKKYNTNNIKNRFDKLRINYPDLFKSNELLSNLSIDYDSKLDIYLMSIKKSISKNDIVTRNMIINDWKQLLENTNSEIHQFGKAIAIGTLIQYGVKFKRGTLTPYIPISYYNKFTSSAFENIENENFYTFNEDIIRSNAWYQGFVKDIDPIAMTFLNDDGSIETVWGNRQNGEKTVRTVNKTFLRKTNQNKPIFLWNSYLESESIDYQSIIEKSPSFISINLVKPEYIRLDFDDETGDPSFTLTKEANAMKKSGDRSWYTTQLYKLVGLDGVSPGVILEKSSKKKTSIMVLYKPINSFGDRLFNEMSRLNIDLNGNIIGKQSLLKTHIPIEERSDNEILNLVNGLENVNFVSISPKNQTNIPSKKYLSISNIAKSAPLVNFNSDAILRIVAGTKTVAIRSEKDASLIGIPIGKQEVRKIGGNLYVLFNRGLLSIDEAGGVSEMLKQEGLTEETVKKYKSINQWVQGKGKLYVYDIKPYDNPLDNLNKKEGSC